MIGVVPQSGGWRGCHVVIGEGVSAEDIDQWEGGGDCLQEVCVCLLAEEVLNLREVRGRR